MGGAETIHAQIAIAGQAPLRTEAAIDFVSDPGFGGIALFVGRVRDRNHGREVVAVEYELFAPLALAEFRRAAQVAIEACGMSARVYAAHAGGRLAVGELAVVVAAGSVHRGEAFAICREVIEHIKHRAPVWKREHYTDGSSAWSEGCTLCHADDLPHGDDAAARTDPQARR